MGFSAIGPRQVYWFAPITAPPDGPLPAGPINDWLADRYAGFPSPVPEILRHTPPEDIIRTDLHDFAPLWHWSQGRVVLLGDAAHAMTPNLGQGGAQAVEDAYVLAEQLANYPDPGRAFAAYEQLRVRKVRWVVKTAWRFGRTAHLRARPVQRVRNWLMRRVPERVNQRLLDRLYTLNY
jgi:2-polyprenyl-6-methoxyphenol hydroxylase-like FAD-dependent oxidoreductase